jgi:signal peptidase II
MKDKYKYFITKFVAVLILFTCDQASKYYILDYLNPIANQYKSINQFLNLVLVKNQGISFGMFNTFAYSNIIFLLISLVIVIVLCLLLIKSNKLHKSVAYISIISGAVGNIFDRIERGAVVDFIEVHYMGYYFPVFNIADALITIGVMLLLFDLIILEGKKTHAQ